MYSIPSYVSDAIVTASNNILENDANLEQTVVDTYKDDRNRIVKREFKVKSVTYGGRKTVVFVMTETYSEHTAQRINVEDVTTVAYADGVLTITSAPCTVLFEVEPAEE